MPHKILRFSEKLYNNPLLLHPATYQALADYAENRNSGEVAVEGEELFDTNELQFVDDTGVAVIPISGPITYKETFLSSFCGMTSYQGIISQMQQASEAGAKVAVLDVDSGGGEAYGLFETGRELRKMADENDMALIAYVDGMSASAAYGLTVAADMVISNPQAEVGSVGVLIRLTGMSEEEKERTVFVSAGKDKIPFDKDNEFKASFIEELQEKVDKTYAQFVSYVAEMRGISEDVIRNTEAKTFDSEDAVNLGLVDASLTRTEFADFLATLVNKEF